ncbi:MULTISPECIES: alpha/beta hydrolase [unclassified Rhizobium]|uniref:alpha/beta hydrolase n=1 Tax=unclassified Rhizobium TaxID=2613769 RepID=UPI0028893B5D|nr:MULTISPECIES: alpha/beta hydrolase [unclassified Rhizobium]
MSDIGTHDGLVQITDYFADGIRVERYQSTQTSNENTEKLVLVHGGTQASWAWEQFAPILAEAGYDVHVLNWFGRGGSGEVKDEELIRMSIRDVVPDIHKVVSHIGGKPILIGHSMGGMACQLYAAEHTVGALVLLAPVVPAEAKPDPVEVPIDLEVLWSPPTRDLAKALFFGGLEQDECDRYIDRMCPESPVRCFEATRFTLSVDPGRINVPVLIVSGESDLLTPLSTGEALAKLYNATFRTLSGAGHNLLLGKRAGEVTDIAIPWLLNLRVSI